MVLYKIDLTKTSILLRKSLPGILVRELDQLSASHKEVGQNKIKTVQTLVSVKIIIYKCICKIHVVLKLWLHMEYVQRKNVVNNVDKSSLRAP